MYKNKKITVLLTVLVLFSVHTGLRAAAELPIHSKRLSPKAVVFWAGDHVQTTNVIVLASKKGLAVIDTNLSQAIEKRIRKAIEKELGRSDFKYIINTHHHNDHTIGSSIYPEAKIIAHEGYTEGMKEFLAKDAKRLKGYFNTWLTQNKESLKDPKIEAGKKASVLEENIYLGLILEQLAVEIKPRYPAVTYDKRLDLDLGDMEVKLYSFYGFHSPTDTLIHVPGEGLLMTGDTLIGGFLPVLHPRLDKHDVPLLLKHWKHILDESEGLRHVVPGHWDKTMTVDYFKQYYNYIATLWKGMGKARKEGITFEEARKRFEFKKTFPEMKDVKTRIRKFDLHKMTLETIWRELGK